jgi:hypothetical protein
LIRIDGVGPRIAGVGATKLSAPEHSVQSSTEILGGLAMIYAALLGCSINARA